MTCLQELQTSSSRPNGHIPVNKPGYKSVTKQDPKPVYNNVTCLQELQTSSSRPNGHIPVNKPGYKTVTKQDPKPV